MKCFPEFNLRFFPPKEVGIQVFPTGLFFDFFSPSRLTGRCLFPLFFSKSLRPRRDSLREFLGSLKKKFSPQPGSLDRGGQSLEGTFRARSQRYLSPPPFSPSQGLLGGGTPFVYRRSFFLRDFFSMEVWRSLKRHVFFPIENNSKQKVNLLRRKGLPTVGRVEILVEVRKGKMFPFSSSLRKGVWSQEFLRR